MASKAHIPADTGKVGKTRSSPKILVHESGRRKARTKTKDARRTGLRGNVREVAIRFVNPSYESWIIFDYSDKPEGQMTPLEKMEMVVKGVTKKDLESLKEKTTLGYDELAKVFSVARATLINKKGDDKFGFSLGEKIVGLADLYSYGYEVFGNPEHFNEWMVKPNRALGGKAPYDLIFNQFGREEVRNVIGRIEYGVYS